MSKEYLKQWRRNHNMVRDLLTDSSYDDQSEGDNLGNHALEQSVLNLPVQEDELDSTVCSLESEFSPDFSSSDEDLLNDFDFDLVIDEDKNENLSADLGAWAVRNRCTRSTINELLSILQHHGLNELPKDSRTLLKTPRFVKTSSKCGGDYVYFGLASGMSRVLSEYPKFSFTADNIDLKVNVDGLPLYKSSKTQLWPILCMFGNLPPFIVAIFCGCKKPDDLEEFMFDFLQEYSKLIETGFVHENKTYNVKIKVLICDAPARQFLKCIKSHNGYFACERCTVEGTWEGRVVFHSLDSPLRNDEDFNDFAYKEHQLRRSVLTDVGIQCIQDFSLDYMHLVCLGVVKRLLLFLKEGPRVCRLSPSQLSLISDKLQNFSGMMPSEFARQPRRLDEVKRWKATEFRQFLLYTGPVVLRNVVSESFYIHFLTLSVAIRIMLDSSSSKRLEYLPYAQELLNYFVAKAKDLYGPTFAAYNVHSLIHLHQDVSYFETSLDHLSCFPFENYLQVLKKFVRKSQNPLSQIVKRVAELENNATSYSHKIVVTTASNRSKDCWFMLQNGEFACVKEQQCENNMFVCDVIRPNQIDNFFSEPCDSKVLDLGIVRNQNMQTKRKLIPRSSFKRKVVCLPYNRGFVLAPLVHDVSWNT